METEKLKKNVLDNLYWDSDVPSSAIKVFVDEKGKVTLAGAVPSLVAKKSAEADAMYTSGVTAVENNLNIVYADTTDIPSDYELEQNVKNVLNWNTNIDASKLDIRVKQGIVTLEGVVKTLKQKNKAINLVSELSGVVDITDEIAVVPTESREDEQVAQDIVDALNRSVFVDIENITVQVKEGSVVLKGNVENNQARNEAERIACSTYGVVSVENNLGFK